MTTTRSPFFISGAAIALIIIAPLVALAAWSEPSQAPTGGNVDPPINTGTQNQNKNGGLSVTSFAVFGSTALNGNTYLKTGVTGSIYRYLNFGADYDVNGDVIASTIGESGYGIRDKDGTIEFKNGGGSWQSIQAILWELCGGPCGGGGGSPAARSWVNVSSSRFIGVTYTNSTGHEIEVDARAWGVGNCVAGFYINGSSILVGYNYHNNSTGYAMCDAYATIPDGATYRLTNDGQSGVQLAGWYELR